MSSSLKITLYALVTAIMLLVMGPREIYQTDRTLQDFRNDSLTAGIKIPDGIYVKQGHVTGFHYELLRRFASKAGCFISIKPCRSDDPWKMLIDGDLDILVADSENDTIPDIYQADVISSIELNQYRQVWVVKKRLPAA